MVRILSTNIISPLGMTSEQNYQAVKSGCSALSQYIGRWGLPEPFAASLFSDEQNEALAVDGFTRFESLVLRSVREALLRTSFDITSSRVVFIMSTTKGNVEMLENEGDSAERELPGKTAEVIAGELGITTMPLVVCNACISGVSAQILAQRLLDADLYDYAIVAGAEVQSKFIVSGFQSFKAVSDEPCRPFDIERIGLNLGEAAATIIYHKEDNESGWHLTNGCVRNDAFHISAPSPKGDGYLLAMNAVLEGVDASSLATISVHGTATMYNDQMESKAIQRSGLSDIPLTALKGYYGHTMGAAGVLETILTMMAADNGMVLGARGFEEIGVSGKVNISGESQSTDRHSLLKMLSGFGGCNGAILLTSEPDRNRRCVTVSHLSMLKVSHNVHVTQDSASVDGKKLSTSETGKQMLKQLYKSHIDDYPKYYKMDMLTRLAFVASELLIKAEGNEVSEETLENRAIVLFNRSSSIDADRQYMQTICDADNFFASPSLFVYTLPNITTGEIAIRNHYTGETSFYILPERNDEIIADIISASFLDTKTRSIIGGWIDCTDENNFEANLSIYTL